MCVYIYTYVEGFFFVCVKLGIHKSMLGICFGFRPCFLYEKYTAYCLFSYTFDIGGMGLDSEVW